MTKSSTQMELMIVEVLMVKPGDRLTTDVLDMRDRTGQLTTKDRFNQVKPMETASGVISGPDNYLVSKEHGAFFNVHGSTVLRTCTTERGGATSGLCHEMDCMGSEAWVDGLLDYDELVKACYAMMPAEQAEGRRAKSFMIPCLIKYWASWESDGIGGGEGDSLLTWVGIIGDIEDVPAKNMLLVDYVPMEKKPFSLAGKSGSKMRYLKHRKGPKVYEQEKGT